MANLGYRDSFFEEERRCHALYSNRFRERKRGEANTFAPWMALSSCRHAALSRSHSLCFGEEKETVRCRRETATALKSATCCCVQEFWFPSVFSIISFDVCRLFRNGAAASSMIASSRPLMRAVKEGYVVICRVLLDQKQRSRHTHLVGGAENRKLNV